MQRSSHQAIVNRGTWLRRSKWDLPEGLLSSLVACEPEADRGEVGRVRLIYKESIWQNPAAHVPALAATAKKKRIAIRIDRC
jgi:hypothetical protein